MRFIPLAVATIFVLNATLTCIPSALAQILQGGIEEHVAPIQDKFRIGSIFSEDLLPGNHKIKEWYRLPKWLTGTFESKTLKQATLLGSIESKNETRCSRGLQADNQGTIWDAVIIPNYARVKSEGATDFDIFEEYKVLESSAEHFRCEIRYTALTVDDVSHKILRAEKRSEIQDLIPQGKNVVEHSKQMRYDQDGKALLHHPKKLEVRLFHTDDFIARDKSPGGTFDYKEEFRQYLIENGLSNLLSKQEE